MAPKRKQKSPKKTPIAGTSKQIGKRKSTRYEADDPSNSSESESPPVAGPSQQIATRRDRSNSSESSSERIANPPKRKSRVPAKRKSDTITFTIGKKQYKCRVALWNTLRSLQKSTCFQIPKACFARVVREIMMQLANDLRIQANALAALQESTEMYLTQLFDDSNFCASHASRVTLMARDMHLALRIRKEW